jgi:hypothetical protein
MSVVNLICVDDVHLGSKRDSELKDCISEDIVYRGNKPFAMPRDIMKGLALLEEPSAHATLSNFNTCIFARVRFGAVDGSKNTVALLMRNRKILDAPLEAMKNPNVLVSKKFKWGRWFSPTFKIRDIYVSDTGSMYVTFGISATQR